jgi:hypothetical protein
MAKDRYEDKKADSLVDTILAVGRVGLMLVGIIGIAVEMFREDGLLKRWLKSLFSSTEGLMTAAVIAIAVYFFWHWLNAAPDGKGSKRGDIPMYAMMAVGAFFLFRLFTTGSL